MEAFTLRAAVAADSAALAALAATATDSGRVAFAPRYLVPFMDAMQGRHPGARGVVADSRAGEVVGAAWLSPVSCTVNGSVRSAAVLHSLGVDPHWRRRGVATAVTRWLLDEAGRLGCEVAMAGIQAGNTGSSATARSWASHSAGRIRVTPVSTRLRPPRRRPHLEVREATADDVPRLASALAASYPDHDLGPPYTPEFLLRWLSRSHEGTPLSRYVLLVDRAGDFLAGVGVELQSRLTTLHVDTLPWSLALANRFLHVVPPDREMRNLVAVMPWHRPDRLDEARYLWRWLVSDSAEQGTAVVTALDVRSPLRGMLGTTAWTPRTTLEVPVRGTGHSAPGRVIDPYHIAG